MEKTSSCKRVICMLLCVMFAFALFGCGDTYTDEDDYANFVKWQARYETEKELVGLLHDYDAAYRSYMTYIENSKDDLPNNDAMSLAFVFEGRTILTDENIKLVSIGYNENSDDYSVIVTFDSVGSAILADITTNNIGKALVIVAIDGNFSSVISSPSIVSAITNGVAPISSFSEETANDFFMCIAQKTAKRSVSLAASAYNDRRAEYAARYAIPDYLPAALSTDSDYADVSAYLQKAEAVGFTA